MPGAFERRPNPRLFESKLQIYLGCQIAIARLPVIDGVVENERTLQVEPVGLIFTAT